jgi:YihY family inner membrane protein
VEHLLRPVRAFDQWQQRHRLPAFAVAVAKRFSENRASHLAALLAYYAFFSAFPLLLLLVTILGFVLDGRPELRDDVLSSALGRIPVLSDRLGDDGGLSGSGAALVVGAAGALWGGLRVVAAAQHAMNEVYDVPQYDRPDPLTQRLRSLGILVVLGGGILAAGTVGALASAVPDLRGVTEIPLVAATIALNIATVQVVFRLLTARSIGWRELLPGAVFAGVGYFGLQQLGGFVVRQYLATASDVYGTFAVVIGLLSWFHLLGQLTVLAAEINAVRGRKLYPRRLMGDEMSDGDRRALEGYLKAQVRDRRVLRAPAPGQDRSVAR